MSAPIPHLNTLNLYYRSPPAALRSAYLFLIIGEIMTGYSGIELFKRYMRTEQEQKEWERVHRIRENGRKESDRM